METFLAEEDAEAWIEREVEGLVLVEVDDDRSTGTYDDHGTEVMIDLWHTTPKGPRDNLDLNEKTLDELLNLRQNVPLSVRELEAVNDEIEGLRDA